MIKNIFVLILIFITSISLSGCFFDIEDDYETPIINETNETKIPEVKVDPEEVIGKAIDSKDISICDQITDENWRKNCIDSIKTNNNLLDIIISGDIKACETIEKKEEKKICISKITENLAKNENLTDNQNYQKIIDLAIEKIDVNLCKQIKNENMQNICIINVKDSIISLNASEKGDIGICKQLKEKEKISECVNNLKTKKIIKKAVDENNSEICNQLNNIDSKNQCSLNVEYSILIQKAIDSKDISICKQITNKDGRENCINNVNNTISINKSKKNPDLELCKTLEGEEITKCQKNIKYQLIVKKGTDTMDINICDSLDIEENIETCKINIQKDMKKRILKLQGYMPVANTNNFIVCKEGDEIRQDCIEYINECIKFYKKYPNLWKDIMSIGNTLYYNDIETYKNIIDNKKLTNNFRQLQEIIIENKENNEIYTFLITKTIPSMIRIRIPNLKNSDEKVLLNNIINNIPLIEEN